MYGRKSLGICALLLSVSSGAAVKTTFPEGEATGQVIRLIRGH